MVHHEKQAHVVNLHKTQVRQNCCVTPLHLAQAHAPVSKAAGFSRTDHSEADACALMEEGHQDWPAVLSHLHRPLYMAAHWQGRLRSMHLKTGPDLTSGSEGPVPATCRLLHRGCLSSCACPGVVGTRRITPLQPTSPGLQVHLYDVPLFVTKGAPGSY